MSLNLVLTTTLLLTVSAFKVIDKDQRIDIHPPFEEPAGLWENINDLPADQQVIRVTGELYDELITMRVFGIARNTVPWVIVVVDSSHIDSKRAKANYDELAEYLNGTVRFGWVDRGRDELLAESFGVTQLPATYLIKDGVAYHYRDFTYAERLLHYI